MTNEMTSDGETVTVPAGKYFLSDPCYVIQDDEWDGWLTATGNDNRQSVFIGQTPTGAWAMAFSTAFGDGVYADGQGRTYGVDSGMIGLVPVDYNPTAGEEIVEFATDVECYIEEPGSGHILHFGSVAIRTGDTDDDDDDYSQCRTDGCDGDADSGDSYDGYCPECADRIYAEEEEENA